MYWKSGMGMMNHVPDINDVNCYIDHNRGAIFLKYGDINNELREFPKNTPDGGSTQIKFKLSVEHKPNRVNFCHFEINCYDLKSNEIIKPPKRKAWVKEMLHAIRDLYEEKAKKSIEEILNKKN